MRDLIFADSELTTVAPMAGTQHRNEFMLLRARLDEALGRPDVAIDVYRRLAETAERPVAAQATLHWVELALRHRMMDPAEAIPRLEILSVIWRGDDVEVGTLGRLGRLYAEAGRWREAFLTARRANLMYADHEITRALHDEAARLFEDLFLSGKGDTLSRVDSLALYFDFKEFTPIGRRGDEIVRRLADRLVELDLLDQAGSLLQHQVDNRLFGAARATVAARLATVRLMDGKPAQALQVLRVDASAGTASGREPGAAAPRGAGALRPLPHGSRARGPAGREPVGKSTVCAPTSCGAGAAGARPARRTKCSSGRTGRAATALSEQDRVDVMRSAIAYSLAEDLLALDRVRAKFAAKMADSADARTFAFLTQPECRLDPCLPGTRPEGDERRHADRLPRRVPEALPGCRRRRAPAAPRPAAGRPVAAAGAGPAGGSRFAELNRFRGSPGSAPVTLDERAGHQSPAVDEHEEDQLEGQGDRDRGQHHHADRHQDRGDDEVDDQERHEEQEADLEGPPQFRDHEGGREDVQPHVFRPLRARLPRHVDEQGEVLLAHMAEHEGLERAGRQVEGLCAAEPGRRSGARCRADRIRAGSAPSRKR